MHVTINGKRWRMVFGKVPPDEDAHCESPEKKGKRILIRPSLRRRHQRLLEVSVHEMIHAGAYVLDDSAVDPIARSIGKVLWKQGWRLPDGPQNMEG